MIKRLLKDFFNVPNMLTVVRIIILPFFMIAYLNDDYLASTAMLVISGCTDTLDGTIARKFNTVTDIGKVLDPLADKLTQISIAIALGIKYRFVIPMIVIIAIKEITMVIFSYKLLHMGAEPIAALWWGKLATLVFYCVTCVIVAFGHYIVYWVLMIMTGVTTLLMVFALIKYIPLYIEAFNRLKEAKKLKK